jgi:hypothetical protein
MASANPQGPYLSKKVTASGVITAAGVGGFVKAFGMTVTTNVSEMEVRDGGASGTVLVDTHMDAATAKAGFSSGDIGPIRFNTDVYVVLAGTGAEGWVVYCEDPA